MAQMEFQKSQTAALNGQATESQARAQKLAAEAQAVPQELEIDRIKAVTSNIKKGDDDDKEFEKRLKISDQLLKEREIAVKEGKTNDNTTPVQQSARGNQRVVPTPEQAFRGGGSQPTRPQGIPRGEI